jgi:phosphatidylglycerol:prolipoprotein diacylglycerol transferase
LYPHLFQLGHFAIPTYGALTALALLAGLAMLIATARRLQLNANKVWSLGLIAILTTLVAQRLLLAIVYFGAFRRHPVWVLGLSADRSPWIGVPALLAGIAAAILYALAEGLPPLRVLDCAAPAAAVAIALNRAGAFLAGLDYGRPALHAAGVVYTSRIAALWYRTPLGVKLYPVQMYESAASLAILAALLWWLPRRTQDGELLGAWLLLYGFAGFFIALFRDAVQTEWALAQPACVFMVALSAAFLVRRRRRAYTVEDGSLPD